MDEKPAKAKVNWWLSLQLGAFLLPVPDVNLLSMTSFLEKEEVGMRTRIREINFY